MYRGVRRKWVNIISTRNQEIQAEMTLRAIELLALPAHRHPALVLDIGCGSGPVSYTHL